MPGLHWVGDAPPHRTTLPGDRWLHFMQLIFADFYPPYLVDYGISEMQNTMPYSGPVFCRSPRSLKALAPAVLTYHLYQSESQFKSVPERRRPPELPPLCGASVQRRRCC